MQQGTLFAIPFDLTRLETIGQAVPTLEGIATTGTGEAKLAFSSDGTLVHVPGVAAAVTNPIDWMTRDGKTSVLRATKSEWYPRFSPDGQKLALDISDGKQSDIWVYEWARDTLTQLTFDPGEDRGPVWSPDGRRIVFASDRAKPGVRNLYWVNADGTGEVTRRKAAISRAGRPPRTSCCSFSPGKVRFAPYTVAGDSFRAEKPRIWSPTGYRGLGNGYPYDIHPDGKRLAIIAAADEGEGVGLDKVVFFFNFGDYLKKIAPVTKP